MKDRQEFALAATYMVLPLLAFLAMTALFAGLRAVSPSYPFGDSVIGNLASLLLLLLVVGYAYYRSVSFYIAQAGQNPALGENEQATWTALFIFFSVLTMSFYFFKFIWPERP